MVTKFLGFYGNLRFITVFNRADTGPYREPFFTPRSTRNISWLLLIIIINEFGLGPLADSNSEFDF
jgi:hypothetical protein